MEGRSGPIFNKYRTDKAAYRHGIRSREYKNKQKYTPTTFVRHCYANKVLNSGNAGNLNLNVPIDLSVTIMVLVMLKPLRKILRHILLTLALQLQVPTD